MNKENHTLGNNSDEYNKALKVIRSYCQNEDCDVKECGDCPYPLSVVRCEDEREYKEKQENEAMKKSQYYRNKAKQIHPRKDLDTISSSTIPYSGGE